MPSSRIFAGSAPARGRREALVRSFASVPRAGAGAEIRLSVFQTVSRAGPGMAGSRPGAPPGSRDRHL